jgi:hypothetical protein
MKSSRDTVLNVVVLLLLAGIVLFAGRSSVDDGEVRLVLPPACDLARQDCGAGIAPGRSIVVSVRPQPLRGGHPFDFSVRLTGVEARSVSVRFEGVKMNMGQYSEALARGDDGGFAARMTLPVCVTGSMRWRATVLVDTREGRLALPFELVSGE